MYDITAQHYGATDVKQIYFDATDSSTAGCDSGSNTDVHVGLPQTSVIYILNAVFTDDDNDNNNINDKIK